MSLWQELKKRSVFKVGITYAIVAWLLVQVADIFFPALQLPEWSVTLVAGLVILGFPVALILAWAYEITPEGIRPSSEVGTAGAAAGHQGQKLNYAILVLVFLGVLLLVVDRYALKGAPSRDKPIVAAVTGADSAFAGSVLLPQDARLAFGAAAIGFDSPLLAVSPQGDKLVFVGRTDAGSRLYIRPLNTFQAPQPLPGTEGATYAFFSPDGAHIGFVTDDKLKRISLEGGDVRTIATSRVPVRGIWMEDDWLVVFEKEGNSLRRVHAVSGAAETLIDASWIKFSDLLPGAGQALGTRTRQSVSGDYADIVVVDVDTGAYRSLGVSGYDPRWLASGHLLFGRDGTVFAMRFDPAHPDDTDTPVPVLRGVGMDSLFAQMQLAVSASGMLAFVPGADRGVGRIVQVDRAGEERALPIEPQKFSVLDLSDDDRSLAVQMADVKDYVWVYDLQRQEGRKLPGSEGFTHPKFAPDGTLAFSSLGGDEHASRIMLGRMDGTAPEVLIQTSMTGTTVSDWSPDGRSLSLNNWPDGGITLLNLDGERALQRISTGDETWGSMFSPDGAWLAYTSNETGRNEIWVRSVHAEGERRQVSVRGGIEPVWCPCGKIFFRRGEQFLSVAVTGGGQPAFGPEALAFTVRDFLDTPGRSFDVSSDGQYLYTVQRAEPTRETEIHVITHWLETLAATVAAGKLAP